MEYLLSIFSIKMLLPHTSIIFPSRHASIDGSSHISSHISVRSLSDRVLGNCLGLIFGEVLGPEEHLLFLGRSRRHELGHLSHELVTIRRLSSDRKLTAFLLDTRRHMLARGLNRTGMPTPPVFSLSSFTIASISRLISVKLSNGV